MGEIISLPPTKAPEDSMVFVDDAQIIELIPQADADDRSARLARFLKQVALSHATFRAYQ